MSSLTANCPTCGHVLTLVGKLWVCPNHEVVTPLEVNHRDEKLLRIFLSYGHDDNEELVRLIRADLEKRGHDVWFDKSEIKAGDDWRQAITEGIVGSHKFVSFLSKHSTRDPGVCRDEIAIAIGVKGGNIQTVLVESEQDVQPPVNIGHIQWLDMHDWKERRAADSQAWEDWYQTKLAEIIRVVESDESRRFAGEIETLNEHLKPIRSEARICQLLSKGFYGREWLFQAVEEWRRGTKPGSRLFWITGDPGVGKSAFAAQIMHTRSDAVIAAQFVQWHDADHRDARRVVRSIAFQLATRLPDYRKLLLTLPEIKGGQLDRKNADELFDYLLANPLRSVIGGGRERYLIVIDALDEAGDVSGAGAGRNPLVEMLARHAPRLPDWLGLVVTSRPESAVQTPLQELNPQVLDTRTEANRDDLREYLRRQLASQLRDRLDADRVVEQILDKSEGVFLYVERFCDDVQQSHLSLDRPDQFPQGLGGIFAQWFRRQFPDLDKFRKDVRPALRAILAAREPLPVEILQRLFNWQDEELRDFTRSLGSLFPVTNETNGEAVKPYHKSLAEWLADQNKAGNHYVSTEEGHRTIATEFLREYRATKASHYCLRNLPYHLVRAGRAVDAQSLLGESGWMATKRLTLGVEAVLSDIELITYCAAERADWAWALGAAVAGALTVQGAFQVPPKELIPIYARAGLGEYAVEMAQYVEDEYSRAYLLLEIADAAETSKPELARRIRNQLWRSYVPRTDTSTYVGGPGWNVIVTHLAYAEPAELVAGLREFNADLQRSIIACLLRNENTVQRLVGLEKSGVDFICGRITSTSEDLAEPEQLFIAGFDPDLARAETRVDLRDARLVLAARKAHELNEPKRGHAVSDAAVGISIYPSSHVQLVVRALLKISSTEVIAGIRQRPEATERIQLLVEISLALIRSGKYEDALGAIEEAMRLDENQPEFDRVMFASSHSSEVEWVAEGVIRGIAKFDPERALTLASESGLQALTQTNLRQVVLWQLPNYDEVKKTAHRFGMPDWWHNTTLRAVHDLAGAYQTWKSNQTGNERDTGELKAMLLNASTEEAALIVRLLREELFPRLWPARQAADITSLLVQVACSVAVLNRKKAEAVLEEVRIGDCYAYDYAERRDRISSLPTMALAGDAERALRLANHLDKDDVGFGAMAVAEIVRLSDTGRVRCEDHDLRFELEWALREIRDRHSLQGVEAFLSHSWVRVNARVVVSIGVRRPSKWRLKHTFAVIAGKAVGFWPEIRQTLDERLETPEDRELALCEASQWMPLDECERIEQILNPALAAIAWARMARRAKAPKDREAWDNRAAIFADLWPGPEDAEALDVLWVFVEETGGRNHLSRKLASRILEQCSVNDLFWTAPALLAASIPGLFDTEQCDRVTALAKGWQDWMHTFKFATSSIPADDANRLTAEHLVRLANAWWKTDATSARECINMALYHAKDTKGNRGRWDIQTEILKCWARNGDAEDLKQALAYWRWGPAFLDAAGSFVERWSAMGNSAYAESQGKAVLWAQSISENVLNAI